MRERERELLYFRYTKYRSFGCDEDENIREGGKEERMKLMMSIIQQQMWRSSLPRENFLFSFKSFWYFRVVSKLTLEQEVCGTQSR